MTRRTGFGPDASALILARAYDSCEIMLPGCVHIVTELHHRRPRGMGGGRRPESNEPANGLAACRRCHQHVESNRRQAREDGYLVSQFADPAEIPVWWRRATTMTGARKMVLLNNDGTINHQPKKENIA